MVAFRIVTGGVLAASFLAVPASAADISVVRKAISTHRSKVVHTRRTVRVVRDYDGTPVVFRPYRTVVVTGPGGVPLAKTQYAADFVPAAPGYYSNGEPVLPHYPRGWPVVATQRYRIMANRP